MVIHPASPRKNLLFGNGNLPLERTRSVYGLYTLQIFWDDPPGLYSWDIRMDWPQIVTHYLWDTSSSLSMSVRDGLLNLTKSYLTTCKSNKSQFGTIKSGPNQKKKLNKHIAESTNYPKNRSWIVLNLLIWENSLR